MPDLQYRRYLSKTKSYRKAKEVISMSRARSKLRQNRGIGPAYREIFLTGKVKVI